MVRDEGMSKGETQAAWEFMQFLVTDEETQRLLTKRFSALAVHRNVYEEQQGDPCLYPFFQAMSTGRLRCDHPMQESIKKLLHKKYEEVVFGNLPASQAASQFVNDANLILKLSRQIAIK